jgi:hypothetical protein
VSRWTHAICAPCWNLQHPDRPVNPARDLVRRLTPSIYASKPIRIVERHRIDETCCFCGEVTSAGIYVRHDPYELRCQGNHPGDEE